MMGMEKMIGSMIGLTPAEMKAKAEEFEGFVKGIAGGLVDMNDKLDIIIARMEAAENGTGK